MTSDVLRPRALAAALALLLGACASAAPARTATAPPSAPADATPSAGGGECDLAPGTLVNVQSVDRTIRTDVRYATANNFTGAVLPGYERPLAMLRPEAAQALARVHQALRGRGFGLKVFDGYRPVRATLGMVAWAERTGNEWVLEQGYVARQSGHNRGGTVDLTLVRLTDGREVEMGTPYDTFNEAAHTANATGQVAANRRILLDAMAAQGFRNYEKEWWHFSFTGTYPPLDVPLRCFR
ncbi:MAG TPA: M15 family metallopeptidase [Longimicrobium sp.]|nr:M15 family metallopeptidase [Longimicrobium sp.]